MEKIPTANELFEQYHGFEADSSSRDIISLMIEFAKLHVEAALKEASEKMFDTYHTICEDGTTKGVFKTQKEALNLANKLNAKSELYHDWVKVTRLIGGCDKESILNSIHLVI